MAFSDLMRREAVEHQRHRLMGEVVLSLPETRWMVTSVIVAAVGLLLAVMAFGSYSRKESISGWVRADHGVVHVQAPEEGIVESLFVADGIEVAVAQPLLAIRLDPNLEHGASYGRRMIEDLDAERQQLELQRVAIGSQLDVRKARLNAESQGLRRELEQYRLRLDVLRRRVTLAERQRDERMGLVEKGFVSRLDAEKLEDAVLLARQVQEEQQQDIVQRENRLESMRHEIESLPHDRAAAMAVVGEKLALLEQRSTDAGRKSRIVLTSPVAGRISDIRIDAGESTRGHGALIDIIPDGSSLQVELFAPSRAIGFLTVGSQVQVRYDAFPYQKFGVSTGKVIRISRSSADSKDLPRGVATDEPTFRVLVELERDHVMVQGEKHSLQPGMTLKADLILERRRIAEYLFAPLFGAARRG